MHTFPQAWQLTLPVSVASCTVRMLRKYPAIQQVEHWRVLVGYDGREFSLRFRLCGNLSYGPPGRELSFLPNLNRVKPRRQP